MRTRLPAWAVPAEPVTSRRSRVLQVVAGTLIGLASAVEVSRIATGQVPPASSVALAVSLAGCLVALRLPVAGLPAIALAPLLGVALGADSLVPWNLAVFAALLLTLRGLPALLTGVVTGLGNLVAVAVTTGTIGFTEPTASIAAFAAVAAAATGSALRGRDKYLAELRRRTQDALATREAAIDRGVAEERVRIARDLHDSVGHRIAVLSMRIGSAEVHLPAGAAAARADLAAARADLRDVLTEVQQILRVLRIGSDAGSAAPTPPHGRIPELVDSFRALGLTVDATLEPLPGELPSQVSAAAYRITQEMLTNARRHGTGSVSLRVEADGDNLVVESVNVRAAPGRVRGTGYGLVGIRERAESSGGTLAVSPDDGLFWVRAELPVKGAAR